MTSLSDQLWALGERAHAPLAALALFGAASVAAVTRDLMKRLLATLLALAAAILELAALGVAQDALAALVGILFAAGLLGAILLARVGEDFGGVDARSLQDLIESDTAALDGEP